VRELPEPRLVRVVTGHFEELQGLRTAAWMLSIAVMLWIPRLLPRTGWPPFLWFGLLSLYAPLVREPLRRYYARRVGRVASDRFPPLELRWSTWLIVALLVLSGARPNALLCLAWVAYPVHVVWSGWPFRRHHLLTVAVSSTVAVVHLAMGVTAPVPDVPLERPLMALMAAVATAGLFDHALLMRTLAPRRETEASDPA